MNWIKALIEFYFSEIEESGRIVRREAIYCPDGRETTGQIIRIGKSTTYYKLGDGTVVSCSLKQMEPHLRLSRVKHLAAWFQTSRISLTSHLI
jgi:hypothetical protein